LVDREQLRELPAVDQLLHRLAHLEGRFPRGLIVERLVGASGIAVNNNAAAIYLALNELAAGLKWWCRAAS
jgi:hypothetical protein